MTTAQEAPKADILIVDDTPANLRLLGGMLEEHGYGVRPVPNGPLALKAAAHQRPDLILLDINMPEMDGYEVCNKLKADPALRKAPVIFISALDDTMDKVKAFQVGGVDYITKPFQIEEVLARVDTHLTIRRLHGELEEHNLHLEAKVAEQVKEISEAQLATIFALSKLAESRDDDTGKHLERVQNYCRILAEELRQTDAFADEVTPGYIACIFHACPLHDIGKVAIPDAVLLKPGKLTGEEYAVMQEHTVIGALTLEAVRAQYPKNAFVVMGVEIARTHHEKWDGSGYPSGLAGGDIPLCGRITAIADVYDALTSARCYKAAFSHEKSRGIILNDAGTHFDPVLVEAFERVQGEFDRVRAALGSR